MINKTFGSSTKLSMVLAAGIICLGAVSDSRAQDPNPDNVLWVAMDYFADFEQITYLYELDGTDLTLTDGLMFQLVADPMNDTDFIELMNWGYNEEGWAVGDEHGTTVEYNADDDFVVASFVWMSDGASYGIIPSGTADMADDQGDGLLEAGFYFRWFNATSQEDATEAGVIYRDSGWVTRSDPEAIPDTINANLEFDVAANKGSTYDGNGDAGWQSMPLVPEPGTFVLFGIGLLTVAARRKLRKSA